MQDRHVGSVFVFADISMDTRRIILFLTVLILKNGVYRTPNCEQDQALQLN